VFCEERLIEKNEFDKFVEKIVKSLKKLVLSRDGDSSL